VQAKDSSINTGKEIPSQEGDQEQGGAAKAQKERSEKEATTQNEPEQFVVPLAEPIEAMFEFMLERDEWTQPTT